jgi:two-component system, chemotaxis family, chemotaxis protein CheY
MHALVADDSRAIRSLLGGILRQLGFNEITEAEHGRQALDLVQSGLRPDVVLIDWNMPVMDGLEFVKAVRADRSYDGLRVVMVTSETGPEAVLRALAAGVDDYAMKPFTADVIATKLQLLGVLS